MNKVLVLWLPFFFDKGGETLEQMNTKDSYWEIK